MKCYNHNDRDAFGISLVTGKGLCGECLEEYKSCIIEKDSDFSKKKIDQLMIGYSTINASKFIGKLFIVIGVIFTLISIIPLFGSENQFSGLFVGIFGIFCLLMGFAYNKK